MRKLIIAITFGALLLPNQALTLGLGDIEVNSSLNQQLDAEITLLSAEEGDAESLIVNLASREEFQRAGLDRPYMLTSIKFSTETRDGIPYIKVVSPKPVREPFLNFLVEVDWPRGHLIREYTLLLDPPIFSGRPAPTQSSTSRPAMGEKPAVIAPESTMPEVGDFRPTVSPSSDAAESKQTSSTGTTLDGMDAVGSGGSGYDQRLPASADGYRIQKGDTAWSLAESLRPDTSVSVEKMMLALLRTNPEAFIQENINGLKRGYILRVPELSAINNINHSEALAMVREQNALWREYQQAMASGKPIPAHDGDMKSDGAMPSGVGDSRLAIVGVDGGSSSGVDPTAMSAEELRNELARTSEQLETERLEKENLRNRVDSLQGQVDNMKGLITIEDQEMADMQSTVSPDQAADPAAMEESVTQEVVPEQPMVDKVAETTEATPEVLEQPAKPVAPAPVMPPMPEDESGLFEDPMILMAGGAGLLVLLALIAIIIKRRKPSSTDDEQAEEDSTETEEVGEIEVDTDFDATQIISEEANEIAEEDHDSTVILQAVPKQEPTESDGEKTVITEAVAPVAPAAEETDDVMAEADVYLAYGIFQQAEELLEGAIKSNPDREMYRVKLCETYYAAKNADNFEATAKALHEHSGGAESAGWLKVAALGKELCPDSDLFKNVDVSAVADAAIAEPSAPTEMDIDLGGDDSADAGELDFDIDAPEAVEESLELPDFDEPSTDSAEAPAEEAELEFDIGDTGALDIDALDMPEEPEAAEEEFSLDIEASELDISDTETTEDSASGDDFVDSSLDFGIDEIGSAETTEETDISIDGMELDLDTKESAADELDISMDLDDDSLDIAMELDETDTTDASNDEDVLDISMDLEEPEAADELTIEDDGAIDLGFDMEEDSDDTSTVDDDDKTMMRSPDDMDLTALDDVDEISTKLDLARAYMDMGDHDGTRSILEEVVAEGNDDQKKEAEDLLKELNG